MYKQKHAKIYQIMKIFKVLGLRNDSMGDYDRYRPEAPPSTARTSR